MRKLRPSRHPRPQPSPDRLYPFERFSESAKRVLTLAQEEAERSHHSYIGAEHILLALLGSQGTAQSALVNLGVKLERVRAEVEAALGRTERIEIRQIIPTSRVKKVIEISFEEARRMGSNYVGTEHMLLGLLIDGEGAAARILTDLGVTTVLARKEIDTLRHAGKVMERLSERAKRLHSLVNSMTGQSPGANPFDGFTENAGMVLKLTLNEAMKSGEKELRTEHLLLGLLLSRKGRAASILKQLGISLRGVRKTVDSLREAAEDNQGLAYATPGVKNVIEIARAATRSGTQAIGSEHLLVGLLSQKRGVAAHILREHGVTLGKVRALLRRAEPQE